MHPRPPGAIPEPPPIHPGAISPIRAHLSRSLGTLCSSLPGWGRGPSAVGEAPRGLSPLSSTGARLPLSRNLLSHRLPSDSQGECGGAGISRAAGSMRGVNAGTCCAQLLLRGTEPLPAPVPHCQPPAEPLPAPARSPPGSGCPQRGLGGLRAISWINPDSLSLLPDCRKL